MAEDEFVMMHHTIFHRRLVGFGFIVVLVIQVATSVIHTLADFLVFCGGFSVRGPVRLRRVRV